MILLSISGMKLMCVCVCNPVIFLGYISFVSYICLGWIQIYTNLTLLSSSSLNNTNVVIIQDALLVYSIYDTIMIESREQEICRGEDKETATEV